MVCENCKGEGTVTRKKCKVDGIAYPEMTVTCFECGGSGEMCDICGESVNVCGGCMDSLDDEEE